MINLLPGPCLFGKKKKTVTFLQKAGIKQQQKTSEIVAAAFSQTDSLRQLNSYTSNLSSQIIFCGSLQKTCYNQLMTQLKVKLGLNSIINIS